MTWKFPNKAKAHYIKEIIFTSSLYYGIVEKIRMCSMAC